MGLPLERPHSVTEADELGGLSPSRLLREPPARNWMVQDVFLRGTVALIAGDGGKGKSLLCQQLATCAVLGRPWLGFSLQPGRCLYLACEDDGDELHRRQWAINRSLGCDMEDTLEAGLELIPRVGQDNGLMVFDRKAWRMQRAPLMDRLVGRCRLHGIQYLIIDTATKTFRGNQNDETQVDDYITELRKVAIMMQGLVILTKHPSLAGRISGTGESGNVAWSNSVRARLYLHSDKAGLVLEGMKSNYGPKAPKVPLRWERGVFVRADPPTLNFYEPEADIPY